MKLKFTLTLAMLMIAGAAWGQTNEIIHLRRRPLNPIVGQSYRFGDDPNTHSYMGGDCWNSTLLHWQESIAPHLPLRGDGSMLTNKLRKVSITITEDDNPVIKAFVTASSTNGFDTSGFIRALAESGAVCEIYGQHWWRNTDCVWPGNTRRCLLCGKEEKREWKCRLTPNTGE